MTRASPPPTPAAATRATFARSSASGCRRASRAWTRPWRCSARRSEERRVGKECRSRWSPDHIKKNISFDADPKFFACLVRFESSLVPTTLPTAYDVYPLDGRHDGGYYTVKDCVTIDVLPRTPGNNVYVGFMVWSNFTANKCRGLVSLNQVIKEIICLQPLK